MDSELHPREQRAHFYYATYHCGEQRLIYEMLGINKHQSYDPQNKSLPVLARQD